MEKKYTIRDNFKDFIIPVLVFFFGIIFTFNMNVLQDESSKEQQGIRLAHDEEQLYKSFNNNLLIKLLEMKINKTACNENEKEAILNIIPFIINEKKVTETTNIYSKLCPSIKDAQKNAVISKSKEYFIDNLIVNLTSKVDIERRDAREKLASLLISENDDEKEYIFEEFIKFGDKYKDDYRINLGIVYALSKIETFWTKEKLLQTIEEYASKSKDGTYLKYYKTARNNYKNIEK